MFAVKSDLNFDPRGVVNLGTVGNTYKTPDSWRVSLGGMAVINGLKGELKYKFERQDNGVQQTWATLRLKTQGGLTIAEFQSINIAPNGNIQGSAVVDLGGVSGGSPLLIEVETTTAEAGAVALCTAVLSVETPVFIGGC